MTTKTTRRLNTTVSLVEFLRPGSYWPQPYSIEMAFEVFRHLVASGEGYSTQHKWHKTSVGGVLGGNNSDTYYSRPVTSIDDLRQRFSLALFARGGAELDQWREDKGISAYAKLPVTFYHYKPMRPPEQLGFRCEADVQKALEGLLHGSAGKATEISLNSVHYQARVIHRVEVIVSATGYAFVLRYGFHTPEQMRELGDSEWGFTLARSQDDPVNPKHKEPFLDTLRRALDKFQEVMSPANHGLTTDLGDRSFVPKQPGRSSELLVVGQEPGEDDLSTRGSESPLAVPQG